MPASLERGVPPLSRRPVLLLALLLLAPAAVRAADEADAAGEACRRFEASEIDGRLQVSRRIAEIDAAAEQGDIEAFCAASQDLAFVYAAMRDAGLACSPERAEDWAQALSRTQDALAGTCR